ncbi:hypothetical protein [Weissella paramesenteroides]|uniref:hypothetical protein n=1 Tax=Weissella paramesenteroides TaxID=1249 RepID=UPI002E7ADA04|nr:hypothetical protein [Weissella paramesenteroides]WPQ68536.1 hypothetical protein QRX23_02800 [Weissella paramesenteroides]
MEQTQQLIRDYFSGRLKVNIKATKLNMAYEQSTDDTKLKMYEHQLETVENMLSELPAIQLRAMTMHEKDKKTWQQISYQFDAKYSVVANWKYQFNKQLQKRLAEKSANTKPDMDMAVRE